MKRCGFLHDLLTIGAIHFLPFVPEVHNVTPDRDLIGFHITITLQCHLEDYIQNAVVQQTGAIHTKFNVALKLKNSLHQVT